MHFQRGGPNTIVTRPLLWTDWGGLGLHDAFRKPLCAQSWKMLQPPILPLRHQSGDQCIFKGNIRWLNVWHKISQQPCEISGRFQQTTIYCESSGHMTDDATCYGRPNNVRLEVAALTIGEKPIRFTPILRWCWKTFSRVGLFGNWVDLDETWQIGERSWKFEPVKFSTERCQKFET